MSHFSRAKVSVPNYVRLQRRLVAGILCLGILLMAVPGMTQTKPKEDASAFPPNFLEITELDPLLPKLPIRRGLSPLERTILAAELDKLAAQGEQARLAGNLEAAFEIWGRELRLRRFLGVLSEVKALGRVGNVAWQNNSSIELRQIRERLETIQKDYTSIATGRREVNIPEVDLQRFQLPFILPTLPAEKVDRVLLQRSLGLAYQQLRTRQLAVTIYNQQLTDARSLGDRRLEETSLIILGALHLDWFDYTNATMTYQALLPLAPLESPPLLPKRSEDLALNDPQRLTKAEVLEKLAYAYEQDRQWLAAIAANRQLIELSQSQRDQTQTPKLLLAIAKNYEAAGDAEQAIVNYQQSYLRAQALQQFGYATDALNWLGTIYLAQQKPEKALQIYQFLLEVDQQSYNDYNRMTTYDQIGKIYLMLQDYTQATIAFRQGLTIARQLKYQEDYFTSQIQAIETQLAPK